MSFKKPDKLFSIYRTQRWRKYMNNLVDLVEERGKYVNYLCRKWKVTSVELYYVNKDTNPWNYPESEPKKDYLFTKKC